MVHKSSIICVYNALIALHIINTLHAEIIYTSPFINAEIKIICLRSKWQVLLSKPYAFPAAGFAKVARNKAGLVYLNC